MAAYATRAPECVHPSCVAVVAVVPSVRSRSRARGELIRLVVDDRPPESGQGALGVVPRTPSTVPQGQAQAGSCCDERTNDEKEADPARASSDDELKGDRSQGRPKQDPVLVVRSMQTQEGKVSGTIIFIVLISARWGQTRAQI